MSRVSRRDLEAWAKRLITHEGMLRPLAREHGQMFGNSGFVVGEKSSKRIPLSFLS